MPLSSVVGAQSIVKPGVCTSSTRPASPYTGQMIYDTTVATTLVWSGTAWIGSAGKVLQVVRAQTSTQVTNATQSYADTGLTATITPSSTTSTILVMVEQNGLSKLVGHAGSTLFLKLFRGSTELAFFLKDGGYTGTSIDNYFGGVGYMYSDSPATTAATTYKTQFANGVNASGVMVQGSTSFSTIVLMEISA